MHASAARASGYGSGQCTEADGTIWPVGHPFVKSTQARHALMELSGVVVLQVAARATVGDITTIGYGIGYWGILDAAVSS